MEVEEAVAHFGVCVSTGYNHCWNGRVKAKEDPGKEVLIKELFSMDYSDD